MARRKRGEGEEIEIWVDDDTPERPRRERTTNSDHDNMRRVRSRPSAEAGPAPSDHDIAVRLQLEEDERVARELERAEAHRSRERRVEGRGGEYETGADWRPDFRDVARDVARGRHGWRRHIHRDYYPRRPDWGPGERLGMMLTPEDHESFQLQTMMLAGVLGGFVPPPPRPALPRNMGALERQLALTDRDFNSEDYELLLRLDEQERKKNPKGLSKQQLKALPSHKHEPKKKDKDGAQEEAEEPCPVCLEIYTGKSVLRTLPCAHRFHKKCIDTWLLSSPQCPVCKASVV